MKVMLGDTVVLKNEAGSPIGIVTQRSGLTLTIRRCLAMKWSLSPWGWLTRGDGRRSSATR